MTQRLMVLATGLALIVLASTGGCSYTYGHFTPNTQYAYPNSNIDTLGPVKAEIVKTTWIITPQLKLGDVRECYHDALSQASGANILINYSEDTTYTRIPILAINSIKYAIEGEAARMTVGKQELK